MEIREMRPWFWILVAALAVVAIGGLVLAISASNESVDQKALLSMKRPNRSRGKYPAWTNRSRPQTKFRRKAKNRQPRTASGSTATSKKRWPRAKLNWKR